MSGDVDDPAPGDAGQVLFRAVSVRSGGIWITAVMAAAGLLFAWPAAQLDFGNLSLPGPGFAPLILSLATIALAGMIGGREWRKKDSGETIELGHRDVLIVFVAMLAVPLLFAPLGAYLTLGLFGAVLLILVARVPVAIAIAAAAAGMVACWYFFQMALGLQLPIGSLVEQIADVVERSAQ
jgi:hypothetical protein